jgi:hypothetical protein
MPVPATNMAAGFQNGERRSRVMVVIYNCPCFNLKFFVAVY